MIQSKRRRGITGGEKPCGAFISGAPSDKFAQSRVEDVGLVSSLQASRGPIFSALTNGPLICHGLLLQRLSVLGCTINGRPTHDGIARIAPWAR